MTPLVVLPLSLSGCGLPGGQPIAISKPALITDPGDPCRVDREDFARAKTFFTDQIVANVGTGALIGAAVGGIGAAVLGGNAATGALIGGAVGAATGGAVAYSNIMTEKYKDQAELAKSVNSDLVKETGEVDRTTGTFARLRACRFAQANDIKLRVRARRLPRPEATQLLAVQKALFAEEIALAKEYQVSMDKRGEQFQAAAATIREQEVADATQAKAAKKAAGVDIPEKRASFAKNIKNAETDSEIAFNIDSSKKVVALPAAPHA